MLIEFTGPSASGKTAFVRHLLKTWPEARSVRRSVAPDGRRPLRLLTGAAWQINRFPAAFFHAWRWHHRSSVDDSYINITKSLRMASEFCVLSGATHDSKLWLLDQGRLQLGSWLKPKTVTTVSRYTINLQSFILIGDGVLLITMAPPLAVERLYQRGDGEKGEKVARIRGFSSYRSLMEFEFEQVCQKIAIAKAFGSQVLHFYIDADGTLGKRKIYVSKNKNCSSRILPLLSEVADQFELWWDKSVC